MDEECVFCGIVAGTVAADVVLDDDVAVAFLDRSPVFKGHVLVANVRAWHSAGFRMLTVDETLPQWRRRLGMWLLGWA